MSFSSDTHLLLLVHFFCTKLAPLCFHKCLNSCGKDSRKCWKHSSEILIASCGFFFFMNLFHQILMVAIAFLSDKTSLVISSKFWHQQDILPKRTAANWMFHKKKIQRLLCMNIPVDQYFLKYSNQPV